MTEERESRVRSTEYEVGKLKSKQRRGAAIILGIIVGCAAIGGTAYYYLRPTPCETVTSDMCLFVEMPGEQCPAVGKALTDMGASIEWCSDILTGKEALEPENYSEHYLSALKTLLDEDLGRYDKQGREPPAILLKLLQKADPNAMTERRAAARAAERAADGGGQERGSRDGGAQDGGAQDGRAEGGGDS